MLTGRKEVRQKYDLRQVDLEKLTGIPQTRLSRLERGVQQPTDKELEKLKEAYGLKSRV